LPLLWRFGWIARSGRRGCGVAAVVALGGWFTASGVGELEEPGRARQSATAEFTFDEQPWDAENIRWYLEDFLELPADPAPRMAARVEARLTGLGAELFNAVFESPDRQRLWYRAQDRLDQVRVEVQPDPTAAADLPWELLRDPGTGVAMALRAQPFVRSHAQPAQPPRLPTRTDSRLRVLLVICRPAGSEDVPFRSVASHLVRSDAQQQITGLDLDVLRPPTFAQLSKVLRAAARVGQPYQVVHFDGHGAYLDLKGAGETLIPTTRRHCQPC
jgi:hypothetical protein